MEKFRPVLTTVAKRKTTSSTAHSEAALLSSVQSECTKKKLKGDKHTDSDHTFKRLSQIQPSRKSVVKGVSLSGDCEVVTTTVTGNSYSSQECLEDLVLKDKEDVCFAGGVQTENDNGSKRLCSVSYKAYHRQIEKQRRNRISNVIKEIADLVPTCQSSTNRLDKLSVLELAIHEMRMLSRNPTANARKPSFLSEKEIKFLIEQNGFLLVLSCDKAKILYVSDAIVKSTVHTPGELIGRSLFDLVHADDVEMIRNMLLPHSNPPSVGYPAMHSCTTGSKRSFYFRLKSNKQPYIDQTESSGSDRYSHKITKEETIPALANGFIKILQKSPKELPQNEQADLSAHSCFIALIQTKWPEHSSKHRMMETNQSENHYSSRHSADATFLSVDKRVFPLSGYLPQELIGNSEYNFVHQDDVKGLIETFQQALENKHQEQVVSDIYRFKMKHGGLLPMRTVASSLFNPFTKELEFVTQQNYVIGNSDTEMEISGDIDSNISTTNRGLDVPDVRLTVNLLQNFPPHISSQIMKSFKQNRLDPLIVAKFRATQIVSSCEKSTKENLCVENSPSESSCSSTVNFGINTDIIPTDPQNLESVHHINSCKLSDDGKKSSSGYVSSEDDEGIN